MSLPNVASPVAAYTPWTRTGPLVFTSGQLPVVDGTLVASGLLGAELTTEQGAAAAETCALNVLAIAKAAAGDLDAVRVVKLAVFVASAPGYTEQHLVANGASQLVGRVLAANGVHARSAIGVAQLPLGAPVEVEAIFEVLAN